MSKNNIAIVTGANKGLGYEIVKKLCEKFNGTVYLTSRNEQKGQQACEKLRKLGHNPIYHQLDITDDVSITRFINNIKEKQVEILINNAGILFLKDSTEPKAYQAEQTILVNFSSLVNFTEAILPLVANAGKIVNISSSSGHLSRIPSEELRKKFSSNELTLEGLKSLMKSYVEDVKRNEEISKGWGDSAYVVSKVGLNAYTFLLNRRLISRGIIVNCVHPGYVMSDMTRGEGTVTPEQAATVPLLLALSPTVGSLYVWHDGSAVPWDGPDPRGYIDGKNV